MQRILPYILLAFHFKDYKLSSSGSSLTCTILKERLSTSFNLSARFCSLILSRPRMIKNDIIINVKMIIKGTLANRDAVFNTSNALSPPTSIRENGNKHNANAQNKRLALKGSPITFFCEAAAKIYEPESNVVARNKNAEIKNKIIVIVGNGN